MEQFSVAGVCERDIDLLVLEEIISSQDFRHRLTAAVGWSSYNLEFIDARRSVTESNGESDLEVSFRDKKRRLKLLIENKISAGFQPDQARRYEERGCSYRERGICDVHATLLLAPRRYIGDSGDKKGFTAAVSYEELLAWFEGSDIGARKDFKRTMLRSAIDRAVLGYQPTADLSVTDFWMGYWKVASERAPQLQMRKPSGKPARSGFIIFAPQGLAPRCNLVHKVKKGFVDLQLRGLGGCTHEVKEILDTYLEGDMVIAKASKSAAVRLEVPVLSTVQSIAGQSDGVFVGVAAAARLLDWAKSLPPVVWARCQSLRNRGVV